MSDAETNDFLTVENTTGKARRRTEYFGFTLFIITVHTIRFFCLRMRVAAFSSLHSSLQYMSVGKSRLCSFR